jgi:hypothetical protein
MLIFLNQHKIKKHGSIFEVNIYKMPPKKTLSLEHPDHMPKLTTRVVGPNGYYEPVLTKAGEELERKKIKDLKDFKENDPEKYSNWKKEFKHDASSFEGKLRDELEKEQATASRRQERASSHSKAKEAHSDAKKHRENSLFGSVMNVIAPLKTPRTPAQTPMDTPQTRRGKKGGKGKRRKRTLKKNR